MKKNLLCIALALVALIVSASAKTIRIKGNFAGTSLYTGAYYQGTFSYVLDLSRVPAKGPFSISDSALESFAISPSLIGQTEFSLANTGINIALQDRTIQWITVGGSVGTVGGISNDISDFSVAFLPGSPATIFWVYFSDGNTSGLAIAPDPTGTFTIEKVGKSEGE